MDTRCKSTIGMLVAGLVILISTALVSIELMLAVLAAPVFLISFGIFFFFGRYQRRKRTGESILGGC